MTGPDRVRGVSDSPTSTAIPEATDEQTPEQLRIRREKRERMLAEGREAYPVAIPRTHSLGEIRAAYPDLEAGTETGQHVGVSGRVIFLRN